MGGASSALATTPPALYVRRAEDLITTGKSGTGKSHILQSFGHRPCQQQFSVRYARCADLLDDLYAGLVDGTYARRLMTARLANPRSLCSPDLGAEFAPAAKSRRSTRRRP